MVPHFKWIFKALKIDNMSEPRIVVCAHSQHRISHTLALHGIESPNLQGANPLQIHRSVPVQRTWGAVVRLSSFTIQCYVYRSELCGEIDQCKIHQKAVGLLGPVRCGEVDRGQQGSRGMSGSILDKKDPGSQIQGLSCPQPGEHLYGLLFHCVPDEEACMKGEPVPQ